MIEGGLAELEIQKAGLSEVAVTLTFSTQEGTANSESINLRVIVVDFPIRKLTFLIA